mgnify:CR=1 FL=1
MGKEYITDTVTLRGEKTSNELTSTTSKITQINYTSLDGEIQSALASQTTLVENIIGAAPITTISLGGFVDSESEVISFGNTTANKIKLYTGQRLSRNLIEFYPGQERFTVDKRGHVGINNPNIDSDRVTFDVRSTTPSSTNPEFPPRLNTPSVAITHPYYNYEGGKSSTPQYIGRLQFRSVQNPEGGAFVDIPTEMAAIQVETNGQANVYKDARVNMSLNTNTIGKGGITGLVKHLEINGYENKTKIFTKLNLGNVPVFRDQEEAVQSGLVNGDVYQDREQNLKIVFLLEGGGERARIE